MFGFENRDWKPLTLFDGTEVLVAGQFNITVDDKGDWYIYPEGDTSVAAERADAERRVLLRRDLPPGADRRGQPRTSADNLEEFGPSGSATLAFMVGRAPAPRPRPARARSSAPGTAFGDIALVPATWMKRTKGIRDVAEWYMATAANRPTTSTRSSRSSARSRLENLAVLAKDARRRRAGRVHHRHGLRHAERAVHLAGRLPRPLPAVPQADQRLHPRQHQLEGLHPQLRRGVRAHCRTSSTPGSTSSTPCSARPAGWTRGCSRRSSATRSRSGAAAWTRRRRCRSARPQEVYDEVRGRIDILGDGGGFVFNAIHNVQASVPIENVLAMFKAYRDSANG